MSIIQVAIVERMSEKIMSLAGEIVKRNTFKKPNKKKIRIK